MIRSLCKRIQLQNVYFSRKGWHVCEYILISIMINLSHGKVYQIR